MLKYEDFYMIDPGHPEARHGGTDAEADAASFGGEWAGGDPFEFFTCGGQVTPVFASEEDAEYHEYVFDLASGRVPMPEVARL